VPSPGQMPPAAPQRPGSPSSTSSGQGIKGGLNRGPDRWNRGAWLFRDSTLHKLEILLDEAFHIPCTGIRLGLDGIIGLVPGVGDVIAGPLSAVIPLAAWIRGVPYVTLVRMAANLCIGVLVGSVPPLRRHLRHCVESQPPQLSSALPSPGRASSPHCSRLGLSLSAIRDPGVHLRPSRSADSVAPRLAGRPHVASRGAVASQFAIQSNQNVGA
jgi:hypothetical protein